MTKKSIIILLVVLLVGFGAWFIYENNQPKATVSKPLSQNTPAAGDEANGKVKLTYATHWEVYQLDGIYEDGQLKSKGLRQYLDEYTELNPNVEIEVMQIPYPDFASKLQVLHDTDSVPDIYQIYSTWGVEFEHKGVLDNPPADIKEDVRNNYVSTAGVTINGDIWGIPTEVNDYTLLYNKEIFKQAGIVDANGEAKPPRTWDEALDAAVKTTKRDASGNITQYGFAFQVGIDGYVTSPFLSLLFTNGGRYLSDDNSKCLLNSPEGIEALTAMQQLFKLGATDMNSNIWDFGQGEVAMVIMAPWTEGNIRKSLGDKFDSVVGVAPIPYLKVPASLQYSWFMGVTDKSQYKQEAWDFLRWFAFEPQSESGTTRYGDLLAETIGAIPSRKNDLSGNMDLLNTPFKKVFIDELVNSVPEPNVLESSNLSNIVMEEIQATWNNSKTPAEAAEDACAQIDSILTQYYK